MSYVTIRSVSNMYRIRQKLTYMYWKRLVSYIFLFHLQKCQEQVDFHNQLNWMTEGESDKNISRYSIEVYLFSNSSLNSKCH